MLNFLTGYKTYIASLFGIVAGVGALAGVKTGVDPSAALPMIWGGVIGLFVRKAISDIGK